MKRVRKAKKEKDEISEILSQMEKKIFEQEKKIEAREIIDYGKIAIIRRQEELNKLTKEIKGKKQKKAYEEATKLAKILDSGDWKKLNRW